MAEVSAMMVPEKLLPVPSVAELVTCQKTLHACAPLTKLTTLLEAVVSADGTWMMKTASVEPPPSRVRVPVIARLDGAL